MPAPADRHWTASYGSIPRDIDADAWPSVVALMEDATDQLGKMPEAKAKHEAAAAKQDWEQANLWAEQVWQYQVKAADIGLRAKTFLEQKGAK